MNKTHRVVLGSNVVLRETPGPKPGEETVKRRKLHSVEFQNLGQVL